MPKGNLGFWVKLGAALHNKPVPPTPDIEERLALMQEHYALMMEEYGETLGVRCARKHLGWYMDVLNSETEIPLEMRKRMLTEGDAKRVPALIDELFDSLMEDAA